MSERLLGIPRSVALLGLAGLVVATMLYARGLGASLPSYDLSTGEIAARARTFARDHVPTAHPALVAVRTKDFDDEGYESLCARYGVRETLRALREGEIVLPIWRVQLRRATNFDDVEDDANGMTLLLDGLGNVVGGTFHNESGSGQAPARDVAERTATERLAEFGVDLTGFVERGEEKKQDVKISSSQNGVVVDPGSKPPDEGRDDEHEDDAERAAAKGQARQKFLWERPDPARPDVKLTVSATVTSGGLVSFGRGVSIEHDSLSGSTVAKIVEASVYGVFVFGLCVALLGVLLSRLLTRDYVNATRALVVAAVFASSVYVAAAVGSDFSWSTLGLMFGSTMIALWVGILVYPAWLAGEADAYFAWGAERTQSLVALFSGQARTRQVARDTLEGYFWGWLMLGVLAVAAAVAVALVGPEVVHRKSELFAINTTPTPFFSLVIVPYVLFFGVVSLLFLPAWLHRLVRRAWIALPVAGAAAGLFAAWLGVADVTFGHLPPSASWALVFGIATCVIAARRGVLTALVSTFAFSTFFYGLAATGAAAIPDAVSAAAGLALGAVPAVAAFAFGPRLVEALVREAPPPRMSKMMELVRREEELDIARRVQRVLLPSADPELEGFDIAGTCLPANEVGGDYYDYFRFADGRFGVAVGDVSGKGVPAAFCMTLTKGFMEVAAAESREPDAVLSAANAHLRGNLTRGTFVTMSYAIIDPESRVVRCARAGHNPPAILRDGAIPAFISSSGTALGAAPEEQFERLIEPLSIELRRGDTLVFYTDGVTEAMSPSLEQFGEQRLLDTLDRLRDGRSARGVVDALLGELEAHARDADRHDDITIVVIKAA